MLSYSFGPQLERPPIGRKFASRLRAPKLILLVWRLKPDSYFLQILTQTSACFRCATSPAPCHPVSSRTVMISEWHFHHFNNISLYKLPNLFLWGPLILIIILIIYSFDYMIQNLKLFSFYWKLYYITSLKENTKKDLSW